MTDTQLEQIEGLIVKAVQSGKKETSDLVDSIIHKMEPAVAIAIEKYVNGHIREVKEHLEKQDKDSEEFRTNNNLILKDIHDEQTKVRAELKVVQDATQPLIDNRKTVLNVGRFVIWIGAIVGACGTIILITTAVLKLTK